MKQKFYFKKVFILALSVFAVSCSKNKDNYVVEPEAQPTSISTSAVSTRYVQNCTLETYTGTWCGYCPRAETATGQAVQALGDKVVPIAFHSGDVMNFSNVSTLMNTFGVGGFPTQLANRKMGYNGISQLTQFTSTPSNIGLAINSSIAGSTLSLSVKARFSQATTGSKIVVYILESGIVASQHNYYSRELGGDPSSPWYNYPQNISNFVHKHVARMSLSSALGDPIPSQAVNSEYAKNWTITLPASYNKNNLSIVALLVKSDNTLLNVQQASVGQNKDFQIVR